MEHLAAARSAASAGGRSPAARNAAVGLRAGAGLRERTRRAAGSPVRGGALSAAALRLEEDGRPAARSDEFATPAADRPAFFFDLACPFSYLAAERVERLLGDVEWVPVPGESLHGSLSDSDRDAIVMRAATMAQAARLPLVWPDAFPAPVPRAMRAALYASEIGGGARFALAASRLAFCGAFDLEKSSVLADVAAAANIPVKECLAAADEEWRDEELQAAATSLTSQGVDDLPVVGVNGRWFDGLGGLVEAAAWLRRD
jgi:2-hydroxychromene-2-carboxylate isomerase